MSLHPVHPYFHPLHPGSNCPEVEHACTVVQDPCSLNQDVPDIIRMGRMAVDIGKYPPDGGQGCA